MPQLTRAEKLAGRWFRDQQFLLLDQLQAQDPAALSPPPWIHHYRHGCTGRGGQSVSFEMREVYAPSPRLWVCYCSAVVQAPHDDCQGAVEIPAGRIAFIYRHGRCNGCGITGRSRGWIADGLERAPLGRT